MLVNVLTQYKKSLGLHIQTSTIYNKDFINSNLHLQNIRLEIHTSNELTTFLHLFMMLNIKSIRKNFFLSAAQKKYQTLFFKKALVNVQLNKNKLNLYMEYLSKLIFRDYMKQPLDNGIRIQKGRLLIIFPEVPFIFYNKNPLFKAIHTASTSIVEIKNYLYFDTKSLASQF